MLLTVMENMHDKKQTPSNSKGIALYLALATALWTQTIAKDIRTDLKTCPLLRSVVIRSMV